MKKLSQVPRIGIYGGTFNPIHLGHLRAAEESVELLGLERMLFVPSALPPHKDEGDAGPIAPARDRLEWVRLAIAGNPRFALDPIEVERGGASYLVDTLRALARRVAPELPVFLIGQDAFAEVDTWREPEVLFTLAHFAVTPRPPVLAGNLDQWLPTCLRDHIELAPDGASGRHRRAGTWIRLLPIAALDISASEIRARLRKGRSVRYLLPEAVREAIMRSQTYAGEQRQASATQGRESGRAASPQARRARE